MSVTVETRSYKGDALRTLSLQGSVYPVEQILSDGEKRAVALADFLTEAALDEVGTGVLLDDPVTSLDSKWTGVLAQCLSEHARQRQVVVFTHDLAFLYRLVEEAAKLGVEVANNWIREENEKPEFVYADNSPVCEKDYRSAEMARNYYSRSKDKPPKEQQSLLQQGFGALRTSYEALVIFELFNGVVARFEERIKFDALKNVRIAQEDVTEIVDRMGTLSRYIEGHLHSDAYAGTKPTPQILLREIEVFEGIRRRVKGRAQPALKKPVAIDVASPVTSSEDKLRAGFATTMESTFCRPPG